MAGKILVSTAYLPPIEYFSPVSQADEVFVEREENYLKQSYRNRCYILSAHGQQLLSVPVYLGSLHKTPIKDIRIDYSKRWKQIHLGAITASYKPAPYFQFYFEEIEKIISKKHTYLFDLNMELTESVLKMLELNNIKLFHTTKFEPVGETENDYRYKISPKKDSASFIRNYTKVFDTGNRLAHRLSIIDLIFNMGPEAAGYL